jgi:hypothetical protein
VAIADDSAAAEADQLFQGRKPVTPGMEITVKHFPTKSLQ